MLDLNFVNLCNWAAGRGRALLRLHLTLPLYLPYCCCCCC